MYTFQKTIDRLLIHRNSLYVLYALVFCFVVRGLSAQTLTVRNGYVSVTVDQISGQIQHIMQLSPFGADLIYPGSATSHTNFYMNVASVPRYFTNNNDGAFLVYDGNDTATYVQPDSVYKIQDSIVAEWVDLNGYDVKQYSYPFLTATSGQIAIEYRVMKVNANTPNVFLGILLELDVFSSGDSKCSSTGNDKSLVLDSHEYEARYTGGGGVCWAGVPKKYTGTNVPDWWHAGAGFDNQNYPCGNCALATGTLKNPSVVGPRTGPVLVPPDEFDIGDWANSLKNMVWNVQYPYLDTNGIYGDCAVIYKWNVVENSGAAYRCCTAYGPNDFANDNYICNNAAFFLDLRFPDTLIQNAKGVYAPMLDTIKLWCTNVRLDGNSDQNTIATLDTTGSCLVLAPGETLSKPVNQISTNSNNIQAWKTGYCTWLVRVDTMSCCKPGESYVARDSMKVNVTCADYTQFAGSCYPAMLTYCPYTVADTLPPVISLYATTRYMSNWKLSDDRKNDQGIDTIIVIQNENYIYTPPVFHLCDTSVQPHVIVNVSDTTKNALFIFRVVDCAGNTAEDSVFYTPAPTAVVEPIVLPAGVNVINYPDPFSRTTQIQISDELNNERPQIRVYSVLGTDVTKAGITSDKEINGSRIITFDGGSLPAGLYNVSIITMHGVTNHRMMLLK
ncbi:MAG TPA: T9SS type A sorting domain-containing protein [Candidatus Kapabacteria bacterium]|nr:T9SS type A sorting domain-containing protein [Candidatus Kapabacteria bacterium]